MNDQLSTQKLSLSNGVKSSCPLLGLIDDPRTRFSFPHSNNACHAMEPACPVRTEHQMSHCLSAAYRECRLYRRYHGIRGAPPSLNRDDLEGILAFQQARLIRAWPLVIVVCIFIAVTLLFSPAGNLLSTLASAVNLPGGSADAPGTTPLATQMVVEPVPTEKLFLPNAMNGAISESADSSVAAFSPAFTPKPVTSTPELATEIVPTPMPTEAVVFVQQPTPTTVFCGPPAGWVLYTVQPGDSLSKLSRAVGTSIDALRQANCLVVGGLLYAGQGLYLPASPALTLVPTATEPPTEVPPTETPTEMPPSSTPGPLPTETPSQPPPTEPPPTATPTQPPSTEPPPTAAPTEPPPTDAPEPTQSQPTATFIPDITPIVDTPAP